MTLDEAEQQPTGSEGNQTDNLRLPVGKLINTTEFILTDLGEENMEKTTTTTTNKYM